MTSSKHLKAHVRSRMERTGESYTTARRHVTADRPDTDTDRAGARAHLPGLTPEATTLRVLLAAAGIVAPHTDEPWTEAMLVGLTGGVGLSIFAFRYDEQDVSTFYVGARRADTAEAMTGGLDRLGIPYDVAETTGAATAERHLRSHMEPPGPVAAWVDAATLGTRGMPEWWEGGMYHVLALLDLDDATNTAVMSDLAVPPVVVEQPKLAAARARIRKQRHRLLKVTGTPTTTVDLSDVVRAAIGACHANLTAQRLRNFTIPALDDLAARMHGSSAKDSWERVFPPGRHLWTALTSLHDFVQHYGTGGGLMRPLYARFLREAGAATDLPLLDEAADRYEQLGRLWAELARAALPEEVELLGQARRLHDHKARLYAEQGAAAADELASLWRQLDELAVQAAEQFPLDGAGAAALRADLAQRTRAIAESERAAATVLGQIATS